MAASAKRAGRRLFLLLAAALSGLGAAAAGPALGQQPACPVANPTYTGNCGPTFVLPAWGDAGGWSDPSQYSTIQLADVDGDGRDELLGRSDAGIQIHEFDTTVGQWRPQLTAAGVPAILSDFRSPLPSEAAVWTQPQYYTTIQTGDVDGRPGDEVLGRFPDGMRVYKYTPGAGGGAGSWAKIGEKGPFSDADGWGSDPSLYSTIQTENVIGPGVPDEQLISRTADGLVVYRWGGSNWTLLGKGALGSNARGGQQPKYYTDIVTGEITGNVPSYVYGVIPTRDAEGVFTVSYEGGRGFQALEQGMSVSVFNDSRGPGSKDCPFTPQTQDCFGSSPSYYETLEMADIDGRPGDELIGRATDGLRVHTFSGQSTGWTANQLPTLSGLAGPASTSAGTYGSIQTANLDGQGGREVLALDGTGLQAWSYNAQSNAWTKLAPSTLLALGADPWLKDPSTYSTIQAGDVDGDGRDDVIARGPFGIRTWFYDRRGTGGWERYLPNGYPSFSTAGQQAAFAELNRLAKADGDIPVGATTVRDVWSGENAPQPTDLTTLQRELGQLGDCTNPNPGNPPSYVTCRPPAGSSGFTAADWTAVVNEMLAESYWAGEVVAHFTEVDGMRESLFLAQGAELPAIGSDLQLQAAADAQVAYDMESQFEEVFQIIGAIAGAAGAEGSGVLSAAFSITGDVLSMLPSSSSTLMSTVNTTYSNMQAQFAQGVTEVAAALDAHSQEVRQDLGLLALVGQLRTSGTWTLDAIGAESAGREGFALWAYKTLLGVVYARYQISDCQNSGRTSCHGIPAGLGVIGGGVNFIALGPPPTGHEGGPSTPCMFFGGETFCQFQTVPDSLRETIWGDVSQRCAYQPGNANTVWTFGCSLGVATSQSVGWNVPTYTGTPAVNATMVRSARGGVRGVGSGRAAVRIAAQTALPRSVNLRRARVRVDRVLHERSGLGELLRPAASRSSAQQNRRRRLTPIELRRIGKGRRGAVRLRGRSARAPRATLLLRKRGHSRLSLALRMPRARLPVAPVACHKLPAALQRSPEPVQLHTRLRIDDGRRKPITLTLRPQWRCRRDRKGTIRRLSVVRPKRPKLQSGLAVRLRGPRTVRPGATARLSISVRNRRAARRGRLRSSFWNAYVHSVPSRGARLARRPRGSSVRAGGVVWRARELRGGKTRNLQIRVRAPRAARQPVCVRAMVGADLARPAGARRCMRVTRAP